MQLFPWKPGYELNIPALDAQHRRLVDMINQLYEAMKDGREQAVLDDMLEDFQSCMHEHFETEERFMQKHKYPELESHRQQHHKLGGKMTELTYRRQLDNKIPTIELMSFLCNWLRDHLAGTDIEFGQYLEKSR